MTFKLKHFLVSENCERINFRIFFPLQRKFLLLTGFLNPILAPSLSLQRIYRLTCLPAPRPWRRSQRNSHCDGEEHHKCNRTFTRILIVVFTIISFSLTPSTPEKPVNFSNHGGHSNTHLTFR